MYVLVKIAGRQYKVSPDDTIKVERLQTEPGDETRVTDVMMVSDGDSVEIGTPLLPYQVMLETLEHNRYPKVMAYRFKRRGGMRKMHGHRQQYTLVKVKAISKDKG